MRPDATRADDERLLMMLHLREAERLSYEAIGLRYGISAAAVKQAVGRALTDWCASEAGGIRRAAACRDGALGPLWWRTRLRARGAGVPATRAGDSRPAASA